MRPAMMCTAYRHPIRSAMQTDGWTAQTGQPGSSGPWSTSCSPDFAVRLWNGERIGPADGPVLVINDRGIVGRVLRRPVFTTLVELWVSKAIDVENGSLFDIVERGPQGKLKAKLRQIPKLKLLRDLPALAFSSGRDSCVEGLAGRNPFVSGSNKEAITHHYDISNDFYRLFLDERMVYSCGYFKDFANGIDQAQYRQARPYLPQAAPEARRDAARHRLRLGRDAHPCGQALWRRRPRRVAVRGPDRARARAHPRRRPRGPHHHRGEALFRTVRDIRQDLVDRHVRASRSRQPQGLFPCGRAGC